MDAAISALQRLGGVATSEELTALVPARELREAVTRGGIDRVRRGRYVLPEVTGSRRVAHELSATVGLRSAAQVHGWKVRTPPPRPELLVPQHRTVRRSDRARASIRRTTLAEHEQANGVTTPLRTVVDCARVLPLTEGLSVADSALRARDVTTADLARAGNEVRGPGSAQVRRVLAAASALSANPFESSLRALSLDVPGLALVPQVALAVGDLRVTPDLVDVGLRLVVEADSHQFHTSSSQLNLDCWRYDELTLADWFVLRFTWMQVMRREAWVTWALGRAVARQRRLLGL